MTDPTIIGDRYTIDEMLGHGGMATVYRGTDNQTGEAVAIKQLKPEVILLDPDIVERFGREGEALRRLNHPNIVKVLATVEHENVHYVVMELVTGGDLRSLVDGYRSKSEMMPIQRVMEIALDLSDALARAHRLKIVHRDLKPANVLVAEDGTPRLTDFGVAHFGDSTRMTQTGALIGTLSYLSPEVCMGNGADVRSDVWAFGVMLYEMLTLRAPFDADNSAALIYAIMDKKPVDIEEYRPDVPQPLVDLVYRMLEKDPDDRVSSVRFVGAQLEAMLFGYDLPQETPVTPLPSQTPAVDANAETPSWPNVPLDVDNGEFLPGEKARSRERTSNRPPSSTSTRRDSSSTRILGRQPRVFVSYQPEDSAAATGRIVDRLTDAFGTRNVFKDVDMATAIINEVDVLLAVVGPNWSETLDDGGLSEIVTGLENPDVTVIPVMVNQARMPAANTLPAEIMPLTHCNLVNVRNDPDFNHDIDWLVNQIKGVAATPGGLFQRVGLLLGVVVVLAVMVLAAVVLISGGSDDGNAGGGTASNQDEAVITVVDPVTAGNMMVLVAEFERVSGDERDVSGQIVQDLTQRFEIDVPFSDLEIRQTPDVVRNGGEARAIAEANTAAIVIWGNYDDEQVQANVDVGTFSMFDDPVFTAEEVGGTVNARLLMDNPRRESLITSVVAVVNGINAMNENPFGIAQNLTILQVAAPENPEVIGNGAAANWHRLLQLYFSDSEAALEAVTTSIRIDPQPLYYLGRHLLYQRLNETELAKQDANTALQIGPDGWMTPTLALAQHLYFFEEDSDGAIAMLEDAIVDGLNMDWYSNVLLGGLYLLNGDNERARPFIDASIDGDPPVNWPYMLASTLALRESRIVEATDFIQIAGENYSNPEFGLLLLESSYGSEGSGNLLTRVLDAMGYFVLSQWSNLLDSVQVAITVDPEVFDLYLLEGLAYCNLGEYEAAEESYTTLIGLEDDYPLAYTLRAEVRRYQGNDLGALGDLGTVLNGPAADQFLPFNDAFLAGEINCTNLLSVDLEALASE